LVTVGGYNTTESVVTEIMRVGTLTKSMGDSTTIDAQIHPAQETDWKTCSLFIVEPTARVPIAGLVSMKLKGFDDSKGTAATKLGVFVLGISDEGSTREVGVEMAVSTGAD
jgi:hypothetical protein